MSLLAIFFAGLALIVGVTLGYYLRRIVALGKRRSIEIDIKQMMIAAKEEAQKVVDEAKKKAEEKEAELRETERAKTEDFKKTEERLIKKEELLDSRQSDIDKESDIQKGKKIGRASCRERV